MTHVLDRLRRNGVHDTRHDFVERGRGRRGNEHQKFLTAPADDHVRFAQCVAQPPRDGDEHGVPCRMAELVVDHLEVVEVDQQQCLHRPFDGAAPPLQVAAALVDEILEMAPVVERCQRIAAALEAELAVFLRQQPVDRPELAI